MANRRSWWSNAFSDVGDGFARNNGTYGRRRKYSNPLYLAPAGLIYRFPEEAGDFFLCEDDARAKLASVAYGGEWEIRHTSLEAETTRNKRFQRWKLEFRDGEGFEIHRELQEVADIYEAGGKAALLGLYTSAHTYHLIARLKREFPNRFPSTSAT
jgi:hypothetical protein